jgi:uncharacterized membrane protein YqjE
MATSSDSEGLYASLKGLIATLVASGHSRLSLLGVEIELQKRRALREVLLAQIMLFCLGVGVLLLVGAVAMHFWEQRVAVLGGAALVFLALAGGLYWRWMHGREKAEPVFASNLAELQEDLRQLKAAAGSTAERTSRGQDTR